MEKKLLYAIMILLLITNLFNIFRLNNLENKINNNIQQSNMIEDNLRNEINSIYSNVDEKLKKQTSILDSYNVEFGNDLNVDNLTIPITVTITPKEYSEGLASSLQLNDKIVEMERNKTTFSVTTDVSIFDTLKLKIILNQSGVQKTETIEEEYDLKGKYLLDIITGGFEGSVSNGSGKYSYNGNINISFNQFQENNPKKLTIIKEINGEIIDNEEIDLKDIKLDYDNPIKIPMEDVLEFNAGDRFNVYAIVVDKYDLTYKYNIINYEFNSDGDPISSASYNQGLNEVVEIKDKDGNIVYEAKYEEK